MPSALSAGQPAPLLQLDAVGVRLGGTEVLREVTWTVRSGERWACVGHNGAGKSTLLRLLSADIDPSQGHVRWPQGRPAGVGRGFQTSQVFDTLTVWQNLLLACAWRREQAPSHAHALMSTVGLGAVPEVCAEALSYGQRRLLDLALAFASASPLVLLDEPTAGLGREDTERLWPVLQRLAQGRTLVLVEHDADMVAALATHVLTLHHGCVQSVGPYA